MATRFPISVRINDGVTDRHVTAQASNVRWKKTAPGGFHSASMTLNLDPGIFTDLGPADRIWIYGPTGATLWEGFLNNPGSSAGDGGVSLDLSATGTVTLTTDRTEPLVYIDRDLSEWEPYAKNISNASASASGDPLEVSTEDGLLLQFNSGSPVGTGNFAQLTYSALERAGMQLGRFSVNYKSGKADSGYVIDLAYSGPGVTPGASAMHANWMTSTRSAFRAAGVAGHPPHGTNVIGLRIRRTGAATNITDDDTWTWFDSAAVVARRMTRAGVLIDGANLQAYGHVRAHWVVEDLLGRLLGNVIDPSASTVEATAFEIDQLTYLDGATAADVLDDLTLYEADFLWEVLQSTPNGYVFNYRAWPTTARYEVSTRDGYDAPGADFDLCNRLAVRWTDIKGKDQVTVVTAATMLGTLVAGVPATVAASSLSALENAGRVRDAEAITLPEGRGSAANAQRVGEQALAAKADPPKAATVVVRRPIVDLLRGGTAMPYELEPGYLVRVRENNDLLRCTEVDVDDPAGTATLTLGEPMMTTEQRIARLARTAQRRK